MGQREGKKIWFCSIERKVAAITTEKSVFSLAELRRAGPGQAGLPRPSVQREAGPLRRAGGHSRFAKRSG